MILTDARVVADGVVISDGWVRLEEGVIAEVGSGRLPGGDAIGIGGRWIGPGFIDTHIHGVYGVDVMEDGSNRIADLARALVRHGVTSFVPATYTASREQTLRALAEIERARATPDPTAASILGVHMEGPFLSAACKGAHPEEHLQDGSPELLEEFLAAALVCIMTLAPEREGNAAVIARLRQRGVVVSVGHSDADVSVVESAVGSGAGLVTHLFNGMLPFHHRAAGVLGAGLLFSDLVCELIADGVHVGAEAMRLAWRAKGAEGLILVSDAGRSAGAAATAADAGRLPDGTLSSSACMLDTGFRLFREANGLSIPEAWPMASRTAAVALGLAHKGVIRPGADADLTVVDEDARVSATFVAGRLVHGRL
ncbi:N-acetylglucosamine-6-phosphate deacetylase [Microbacterium sp.]|uniref:N-acetylglucosamine-6-phosphate deacetylase n=1 Tax=Microbacterium sp. TaxID=51671 RepID=UPI003F976AAB